MIWERISSLFHSSKGSDSDLFLKKLNLLPLSQTCYIQWYLRQKVKQTGFQFTTTPFSFIFRYENKFHCHGRDAWDSFKEIKWYKANNVLFFSDSNIWEEIQSKFTNFRSLETNERIDNFNTYSTYELSIENFNPKWKKSSSIIQLPDKNFSIPKRYRHLNEGVAYGFIENNEVLSFAAAPHLLQQGRLSFAIIRGIETKLLERKQGYSKLTVTKLCQHLLADLLIRKIFLWVEETNRPAINLYEDLGFIKDKTIYATFCDLL
ncbi:MAG: GNAT family N-acetyltransferase [Candidatus Hodarchaeales archaeon]